MQLTTDLHTLFIIVLAVFTFSSTFLSAYSILNVLRLRNVRIRWKAGTVAGYPLFASLFLVLTVLFGVIIYNTGNGQYFAITACYGWIGLNWFVASYLASKRYITDHGIAKNINDPSQTVAWHQMTDYVEQESADGSTFIFIYQDREAGGRKSSECIRIELFVPSRKLKEFKKIVSYKLGKTISPQVGQMFNVETLD